MSNHGKPSSIDAIDFWRNELSKVDSKLLELFADKLFTARLVYEYRGSISINNPPFAQAYHSCVFSAGSFNCNTQDVDITIFGCGFPLRR